jgi:hypothetical protein
LLFLKSIFSRHFRAKSIFSHNFALTHTYIVHVLTTYAFAYIKSDLVTYFLSIS